MVAMLGYSGQAVMTGVGPLKNLTDHITNPGMLLRIDGNVVSLGSESVTCVINWLHSLDIVSIGDDDVG